MTFLLSGMEIDTIKVRQLPLQVGVIYYICTEQLYLPHHVALPYRDNTGNMEARMELTPLYVDTGYIKGLF